MPFKGVSADDRRIDRRNRLVGAAFEIAGTEGAGALGVGRVVPGRRADQAIFLRELRVARRAPERRRRPCDRGDVAARGSVPARPGPAGRHKRGSRRSSAHWWTTSRLARVLLAETHGGALSPFRHQIIDVAIAGMAPPGSDPQADLRARLVAYAQIGTLSELCLAWHQGQLAMERATLVDVLADLFVRIDGARSGAPGRSSG